MHSAGDRFVDVKKIGIQSDWVDDTYHRLLIISWFKFFIFFFSFFICFNLAFAVLYWIVPSSLRGSEGTFLEAFAFSVQTFSTIGYGILSPQGPWSHSLVTVEAMLSIFITAVLTGITFAKFSRSDGRIIFSDNFIITQFDGKPTLMFRMGNMRLNHIAEASLNVVALMTYVSSEGERLRKQVDVPLMRKTSLFFALSWVAMHVIDENSPFYKLSAKDIKDQNIELAVSMIGFDETLGQTIHANCIYVPDDVIFGGYFEDILLLKDGRVTAMDFTKMSDLRKPKTV